MTSRTLYLHGQGIGNETASVQCAWIQEQTGLAMTPLHYHDLLEETPVRFLGHRLPAPPASDARLQLAHYLAELEIDDETAQRLPSREITRAHLYETYRSAFPYLTRRAAYKRVRRSLLDQIVAATTTIRARGQSITLVGHSLGSVIALDLLQELPACVTIDRFVTLGSPLGMLASLPGTLGSTAVPETRRAVQMPWHDFATEGDLLATVQRLSRRRQFAGDPLAITTILGNYENPHESYFIDLEVARTWTSACR